MAPETVRPAMLVHFPIPFLTLHTQSAPTLHGPPGPTQCRACQTKPNGSLHASGRSCASNEGRTKTLPALPLRAARREQGSGANMPLLLNSMTLPNPSRDSPDKMSWLPANLNYSGSKSCSSDRNNTFLMPGSGNTRSFNDANSAHAARET